MTSMTNKQQMYITFSSFSASIFSTNILVPGNQLVRKTIVLIEITSDFGNGQTRCVRLWVITALHSQH